MGQRSISPFLAINGLSIETVHNGLLDILLPDVIVCSKVTKYLHQREPPTTIIDDAILDALEKQPLSFIQELVKVTCIRKTMLHWHSTRSLGCIVKHLHWITQSLTNTQKAQRMALSYELLSELPSIKRHGSQFVIILDETWF
jgi:hypothetical protein